MIKNSRSQIFFFAKQFYGPFLSIIPHARYRHDIHDNFTENFSSTIMVQMFWKTNTALD